MIGRKEVQQIDDFFKLIEELNGLKTCLLEEKQDIHEMIVDINHEIELSDNKNGVEGYKIYAQQRDILRRRRVVKNDLQILEKLKSILENKQLENVCKKWNNSIKASTLKEIERHEEIAVRINYKPKILNNLTITNKKPIKELKKSLKKLLTKP